MRILRECMKHWNISIKYACDWYEKVGMTLFFIFNEFCKTKATMKESQLLFKWIQENNSS